MCPSPPPPIVRATVWDPCGAGIDGTAEAWPRPSVPERSGSGPSHRGRGQSGNSKTDQGPVHPADRSCKSMRSHSADGTLLTHSSGQDRLNRSGADDSGIPKAAHTRQIPRQDHGRRHPWTSNHSVTGACCSSGIVAWDNPGPSHASRPPMPKCRQKSNGSIPES